MAVPYTFGSATSAIPLSQLDSNFATTITLGNTAIQLGNTVTTLNNMTLANVTISSGNVTITNVSVTTANVSTLNVANAVITTANVTTVNATTVIATTANATTANITTGNLTDLNLTNNPTFSGGTANGVLYLNASKVATSGSALTFDGTNFANTAGSLQSGTNVRVGINVNTGQVYFNNTDVGVWRGDANSLSAGAYLNLGSYSGIVFATSAAAIGSQTEGMRLTSTGLGIGTSSPTQKLEVAGAAKLTGTNLSIVPSTTTSAAYLVNTNTGGNFFLGIDNSTGGSFGAGAYGRILYSSGAYPMVFFTNDTERMRLDSSGNLGLGVTPSAWGSGYKAYQNLKSSWFSTSSRDANFGTNVYVDAVGYKYIDTAAASLYTQYQGAHSWYYAASGTAGNAISFTQAMTLFASGGLSVGNTSDPGAGNVNISGNVSLVTNGTSFQWTNSGNNVAINGASGVLAFYTGTSAYNERARIDSSGNLLVGTTSGSTHTLQKDNANDIAADIINSSSSNCYGLRVRYSSVTPNTVGYYFYRAQDSSATRFEVYSNGGIANYQANDSNLSDRREKTDFAPAKSYLETICAIPVQTFKYIDQTDDEKTLGVVAQDVQAVAPELVSESNWGTEDDPKVRLSIYQTDLQYALMKCIQELNAKVQALESQLKGA